MEKLRSAGWRGRRARQALAGVILLTAALLLGGAQAADNPFLGDNLHAVVPGRIYRSAQLDPPDLARVIRRKGLRAVLNLKGGKPEERWLQREQAVCERLGARHFSISLRASALPPPRQLDALLYILDTSEYPLLFHCEGGADRSGLVATLALHLYRGVPLDEAEARGLAWRYGHLPFLNGRLMGEFFDLYRRASHGLGLREWIGTRYPVLYDQQVIQGPGDGRQG